MTDLREYLMLFPINVCRLRLRLRELQGNLLQPLLAQESLHFQIQDLAPEHHQDPTLRCQDPALEQTRIKLQMSQTMNLMMKTGVMRRSGNTTMKEMKKIQVDLSQGKKDPQDLPPEQHLDKGRLKPLLQGH